MLNGGTTNVIQAGDTIRTGEAGTLEIRRGGSFNGSVIARPTETDEEEHATGYSYVSLLMNSDSGSNMTLNGNQMTFKDVTAQSGTLMFGSGVQDLKIMDSINIARGGTIAFFNGLHLSEGQTLRVISALNDSSSAATMAGDLTLDGGKLHFTGTAMETSSAAALEISSGTIAYGSASSLVVDFSDTGVIRLGKEYMLSSSNWANIQRDTISASLDYLQASFKTDASGLRVEFSTKEDTYIWHGTSDRNTWSSSVFGSDNIVVGDKQTAVFNNLAQNKTVDVTDNIQVAGLIFDSSDTYSVFARSGASLQADSMLHMDGGTTTLGRGVTIIGNVDMRNGTLILEQGSRVGRVEMAEGTNLEIKHDNAGIQGISGHGNVSMSAQGCRQEL